MSSKFPVRHSQLSPLALIDELKKRYNLNNLVSTGPKKSANAATVE